jgi:hypothetical protein
MDTLATNHLSQARARSNIGLAPLILAAEQTNLLYLTETRPESSCVHAGDEWPLVIPRP